MQSLVEKTVELRTAMGVVQTILQVLEDEEFSVDELANCVEKDPTLTARVLCLVNSTGYGTSTRVSSLQQAISLLGIRKLRTVVLTSCMVGRLTRELDEKVYLEYWKRSITTSIVANLLAKLAGAQPDSAYTAGLLADIGVLVLAQFESEKYLPVFKSAHHGEELILAEREAFGFDHAELSAGVLKAWGLPDELAEAVAAHHDPEAAEQTAMSRVVRAANLMPGAIWITDGSSFKDAFQYFEATFRYSAESFISLCCKVNEQVDQEAQVYGLNAQLAVDADTLREQAENLLRQTTAS